MSLVKNCQPSQYKTSCGVRAPVTIRLSKFVQPFLQLRNTIQLLGAVPYRLSSGPVQSCLSYFESEYLPRCRSRGSILNSDEQRGEITDTDGGSYVPGKRLVAFCLPELGLVKNVYQETEGLTVLYTLLNNLLGDTTRDLVLFVRKNNPNVVLGL